jgi:hypothetical protein
MEYMEMKLLESPISLNLDEGTAKPMILLMEQYELLHFRATTFSGASTCHLMLLQWHPLV